MEKRINKCYGDHCLCQVLVDVCRVAIRSTLAGNVTKWHRWCRAWDGKSLEQVIKTDIIGKQVPSISDIGEVKGGEASARSQKETTRHSHSLFTLLPSGKRHRSICCRTTRLQSSFSPQAVSLLNSSSTVHLVYLLFFDMYLFPYCCFYFSAFLIFSYVP